MEKIRNMTRNSTFMRRFESDQVFLNHLFPERLNVTRNKKILAGQDEVEAGEVVSLPFEANMQTHVEVHDSKTWMEHLPRAMMFHFTEKKGWQCPNASEPMTQSPLGKCNKSEPACFCGEGTVQVQPGSR